MELVFLSGAFQTNFFQLYYLSVNALPYNLYIYLPRMKSMFFAAYFFGIINDFAAKKVYSKYLTTTLWQFISITKN